MKKAASMTVYVFDGLFFISSALLAIFFGAALANVIRGVPLGEDGYFFLPLWTNWQVGPEPGILDWYSVLASTTTLSIRNRGHA
jgi:cytochrome bd ubiquinol oxidase subunit II